MACSVCGLTSADLKGLTSSLDLLAPVPTDRALGAHRLPCCQGSRGAGRSRSPQVPVRCLHRCGPRQQFAEHCFYEERQTVHLYLKTSTHVCSLAKRVSQHLLLITSSLLQLVAMAELGRMRPLFKPRSCFRHSCDSPDILFLLKAEFISFFRLPQALSRARNISFQPKGAQPLLLGLPALREPCGNAGE